MNAPLPTGDLTDAELTASLALEADATPEPWLATRDYDTAHREEFRDVCGPEGEALFGCPTTSHSTRVIRNADNDSEYVARVRNEHPRLLAEVLRRRTRDAEVADVTDEALASALYNAFVAHDPDTVPGGFLVVARKARAMLR